MEGILLIDKPKGMNAFRLVSILRKRTNVKKVGHAGTLDPLASGLMVLLVGKKFTQQSDSFLTKNKEYQATIFLGTSTTTYDQEGPVTDLHLTISPLKKKFSKSSPLSKVSNCKYPLCFLQRKSEGKNCAI